MTHSSAACQTLADLTQPTAAATAACTSVGSDGTRELGEHSQDRDDDNDPQEVVAVHGLQPGNQGECRAMQLSSAQ
jgi:hypothetical protein